MKKLLCVLVLTIIIFSGCSSVPQLWEYGEFQDNGKQTVTISTINKENIHIILFPANPVFFVWDEGNYLKYGLPDYTEPVLNTKTTVQVDDNQPIIINSVTHSNYRIGFYYSPKNNKEKYEEYLKFVKLISQMRKGKKLKVSSIMIKTTFNIEKFDEILKEKDISYAEENQM